MQFGKMQKYKNINLIDTGYEITETENKNDRDTNDLTKNIYLHGIQDHTLKCQTSPPFIMCWCTKTLIHTQTLFTTLHDIYRQNKNVNKPNAKQLQLKSRKHIQF